MVLNKSQLKNVKDTPIKYDREYSGEFGTLVDEKFVAGQDLSFHKTAEEAYAKDRKILDNPERNFTPISVIEKKVMLQKREVV